MGWVDSLIERMLGEASARAQTDSPRAREILIELKGKTLGIRINGTPWEQRPILIVSSGLALELAPQGMSVPDAMLSGAPLSLLTLMRSEPRASLQPADAHSGADVHIEGDAQIVERFGELARLLAPDLEHSLSQLLGRSTAHLLMRGLRAAADSARTAAWTSVQNVAEYLAHESGDLVSRQEATHFMRGVEQAREQLDRLEARLARLEQHAGSLAGGSEPA